MNLCVVYWVQQMDAATKQNKCSLCGASQGTRAHATREQPMDTGPFNACLWGMCMTTKKLNNGQ